MSTIALKAVIVAGTGTGASFTSYKMSGDLAVYREVAPVGMAGLVAISRLEPKASRDYAGAARGSVKITRQFADAQGVLRPAVFTVTTSIPAFLTDAVKTAFVTEAVLLTADATSQDALSKLIVPQS